MKTHHAKRWRAQREQGVKWAAGVGAMSVGLILLYRFDPATSWLFPPCPFHALTGLSCPGCGTTRALHQLLHGRFLQALDLNPLMVLSLPFLGYAFLSHAVCAAGGRPLPRLFSNPVWGRLALGIVLAYWILRNLPFYPFSWLAP